MWCDIPCHFAWFATISYKLEICCFLLYYNIVWVDRIEVFQIDFHLCAKINGFSTINWWLSGHLKPQWYQMFHVRSDKQEAQHISALRWRHNGHDCVSNHQPHHCLLNRLFGRRSKKTSKLRVTGLCVGNSPVPGEFPAQMASNAENVSIWLRHHGHPKSHTH